jgi:hypothetical protein
MKQSEARILIIQQWDQWISTRPGNSGTPTAKDSLKFFHELQDARSPLLDFVARGDKWRVIYSWLLDAEQLSDHWAYPARRAAGLHGRPANAKAENKSNSSPATGGRDACLSKEAPDL